MSEVVQGPRSNGHITSATRHRGGRRGRSSRLELICPNCKVIIDGPAQGMSYRSCPYCGSSYANTLKKPSRRGARSASPRLPRVPQSKEEVSRASAVGNLLKSSLTSLTLGSLGLNSQRNDSDRLPAVPDGTKNKLVQYGSGNVKTRGQGLPTSGQASPVFYEPVDMDQDKYNALVAEVKQSKDYTPLQSFIESTFRSPASICSTFKHNPNQDGARMDDPEIDYELLFAIYDSVKAMNVTMQKSLIRSAVSCLLDDTTVLYAKDHTRCLFVLLLNPLFVSQSTYTILAHLLQKVTRLPNGEHQLLVHWFRTLPKDRFRAIIQELLQFVTIRQFPPADKSLPPLSKSRWWIPTATKVLALVNASNNLRLPASVDYTEFYNMSLDHMDLMQEYYTWQNPERANQFSYCQYPFILSIVAKQHILTKDSEQQMILTARRSLVQKMTRHQQPHIEIFFLNISVRRDHLVEDSLKEISEKQKDLKKKLKISFTGEPGLDMGGLTKEWFQLLIKSIFEPEYGMFVYYPHSRCYWFSLSKEGNLREYNLIGVLMGLAVYNSIILDLHFPPMCYRKLLTPPVVPANDGAPVGIVPSLTVSDLRDIMPDVTQSLANVLEYEGDIAEDLMLTFSVSVEEYGKVFTTDLKPNGDDITVTNENRKEFVQLYLEWLLNSTIRERFNAFYLGFHSVCASNALIMLRPEEVEQLVCGSQTFDVTELKKVTFYDGYKVDDPTIICFWEVLEDYSEDLQKKFLRFTTGSDRVPVGGTGDMTIKITRMKDRNHHLPIAHTCFNQIGLPDYKDKDRLKRKLTIAISNAEGFGLE
eukprot:maker-scaffold22_size673200-snap-gene-2.20 protein:Tk12673 transcript:maker-scaffold22_size673200-snap-gene-2.20-mRNA-1 annotation:"e3 ubiquitin-protein ligase hectd2"